MREDEALPTGCDDDSREVGDPDVGGRPQVCDLGIPTVLDPCVHDPPAIVDRDVVGQYLRESVPVARCEVRHVALGHLACRVCDPPRRRLQLLEAGECGVEVINLVQFHPTFAETEGNDAGPLQFVSVLVSAFDDEGGDASVGVESMHRLHPVASIGHQRPQLLDRPPKVFRCERDSPMVGIYDSAAHRPPLVTVQFPQHVRQTLPATRVRCRFSREVPRIELRERGVDVVEVEPDDRGDSVVGVDLDDVQDIRVERLGANPPRAREAFPTGCDDGRGRVLDPKVGESPVVRDVGLSTAADPTFTTRRRSTAKMSSSNAAAIAAQSRASKYVQKRS